MSWSKVFDIVEGGANLLGAFQASRASSAANDQMAALTGLEQDRVQYIHDQSREGGDKLAATYQALLDQFGSFGQVGPDSVAELTQYFADNRARQEAGNRREVDVMTSVDIADLLALEGSNRATAEGRVSGYEGAFREWAQEALANEADVVFERDEYARSQAPDTLDFAQLQDSLTVKFAALRAQNTQRALANQYAKATANIPPGMENSTLRVQMERSMADLAAQRQNEDMLAAVGDAQNYIAGLQGAASNQQGMEMKEREMYRLLGSDAINNASGRMQAILAGGAYGADLGGAINKAGWAGGEYGMGVASEKNAMRGRAISELSALHGLRNDTAYEDYSRGLTAAGAENELAAGYIDQIGALTTNPYKFRMQGPIQATHGTGLNARSSIASTAAKTAAGNMGSLGDWWANTRDTHNF